jgi:hypothetical protein
MKPPLPALCKKFVRETQEDIFREKVPISEKPNILIKPSGEKRSMPFESVFRKHTCVNYGALVT